MADMTDLDNILEDDLMDALGDLGSMVATSSDKGISSEKPVIDDITIKEPIIKKNVEAVSQSLNITASDSSIDNIANLLRELLNNKTIEITIKIKDS